MYFRLLGKAVVLVCLGVSAEASGRPSEYEIAARFAPVIFQETGSKPKSDAISKFDFDGDWNAYNNWDNLAHSATPAYVYSSVIESETHYFIAYGLFHARDYTRFCLPYVCHDNDMEGALITVQKTANGDGLVRLVETKAHTGMPRTTAPLMINGRVALRVEKQGHGVHPMSAKEFQEFAKKKNVLEYHFTGVAEDPNSAKSGRFGYELVSIYDSLWAQRTSVGKGKTFGSEYEYRGERYELGKIGSRFGSSKYPGPVSPPWAWNGRGKDSDWFFDPAYYRRNDTALGQPYSTKYLKNSFVHIF